MRILQQHADFIEYLPVAKEISQAEAADNSRVRIEDVVVLFTAVESQDDSSVVSKACEETAQSLAKLGAKSVLIYPYAHLSNELAEPAKALQILKDMEELLAKKGISVKRAPFGWNKSFTISVKGHPLAEQSRYYSPSSTSQRLVNKREPTFEEMLAKAKKSEYVGLADNDHRILGERLDLFSFYELSPSMPFWHDKGITLKNILIETIRKELKRRGYIEISTAPLANIAQWKISGHWDYYRDNMFLTKLGEEDYSLKPMNCPSTLVWYKSRRWSYRDLPLRVACFDTLFRKELSGVATGLLRVKTLQQDDAHIICTEEQIEQELFGLIDLMHWLYSIFGLSYKARVSTMPDEHMGTEEQWNKATEALIKSLRSKGLEPEIKEKDGAFYGPKIDVDIKDSLGRFWQCATIQLDYQLPMRFKATYIGPDGQEHTPVMIHRAIYGSIERFVGVMLEHYAGKLPVWLSPIQARVIPISDQSVDYSRKVLSELIENGVRADSDFDTTTLNFKVRKAQLEKIPYMLIIGSREVASSKISVRTREGKVTNDVTVDEFVREIKEKNSKFM
ncbi:MAG: threonine--tRNA ligase [Nitrososphaerota archaeon]